MHSAIAPVQNSTFVVVCPGAIARHTIMASVCRHDRMSVSKAGALFNVNACEYLYGQDNLPYLTS
jgi:hypothetical protein